MMLIIYNDFFTFIDPSRVSLQNPVPSSQSSHHHIKSFCQCLQVRLEIANLPPCGRPHQRSFSLATWNSHFAITLHYVSHRSGTQLQKWAFSLDVDQGKRRLGVTRVTGRTPSPWHSTNAASLIAKQTAKQTCTESPTPTQRSGNYVSIAPFLPWFSCRKSLRSNRNSNMQLSTVLIGIRTRSFTVSQTYWRTTWVKRRRWIICNPSP